jgi:hypothetical protein
MGEVRIQLKNKIPFFSLRWVGRFGGALFTTYEIKSSALQGLIYLENAYRLCMLVHSSRISYSSPFGLSPDHETCLSSALTHKTHHTT